MLPYFYSLGMLVSEYYSRAASAMREPELRESIAEQVALEEEENQ